VIGWQDLVGHERIAGTLRRCARDGRPHGAYLLLGPRGSGKATLARLFAASLLCERDDAPCGECPTCTRVEAGSHPDVRIVEPSGRSHTIGVDAVSEIQRALSYRRLDGRYRVVIFDEAGTMNPQSQNKLLKTLEEPPEGTILLLCALHPGQLLVTVRSRCQKLVLGAADRGAIASWLHTTHGAAPDVAQAAAAAGRGLPGRSLTLIDPEEAGAVQARTDGLIAALGRDPEARASLISSVDRDREGCVELVGLLQELLRDAMVAGTSADVGLLHPTAVEALAPLRAASPSTLAGLVGAVEDTRERLARNVHPGGLLDDLLSTVHRSVR
jgi:DNA polymerase III delta' subunit